MKILFVCKYNAFRSRVAEEYFNKVISDKKIKGVNVISRGIIIGQDSDSEQRRISKSLLGANIGKRKPIPLTYQDMKDSDMIIVVADDIPRIVFNYPLPSIQKKIVMWSIKDEQDLNKENIKNIVLKIKGKVDSLVQKLEGKRK